MQKKIIIRADGGTEIGMGHVIRTLALAAMLDKDFRIIYAIQEPSKKVSDTIKEYCEEIIILPAENSVTQDSENFSAHVSPGGIVVLDGYGFDTAYQEKLKQKAAVVICIDDLQQHHFVADMIINQAMVNHTGYSAEKFTRIFTGNNYFLLREPFLDAAKKARQVSLQGKVVISMGGGDPNNLTIKMMKACEQLAFINEIHVIAGTANSNTELIKSYIASSGKQYTLHQSLDAANMVKVMAGCDTIICPSSTTAIEACAVKMAIITGTSFNNQADLHQSLVNYGCVISVGDLNKVSDTTIKDAFDSLNKQSTLDKLLVAQSAFVDGRSGERIKTIFRELAYA